MVVRAMPSAVRSAASILSAFAASHRAGSSASARYGRKPSLLLRQGLERTFFALSSTLRPTWKHLPPRLGEVRTLRVAM